MSAAALPASPPPEPAAADQPSRVGRLLTLVRRLIDYGRQLATSLHQRTFASSPAAATSAFASSDIAVILARITRALQRATALEAGLLRGTAWLAGPLPLLPETDPDPRPPRAAAAPAQPADTRLARLPTVQQIADEIRRRPAGAVIADICRDLGILPHHPLWREISLAVVRFGGRLSTLFSDICGDLLLFLAPPTPATAPAASPAPSPPPSAPAGTGPP